MRIKNLINEVNMETKTQDEYVVRGMALRNRKHTNINIAVEPKTRASLEALAIIEHRTLSNYCSMVFKKHIEDNKQRLEVIGGPADEK